MEKAIKHISELFGKHHFWDINMEVLHIEEDKAFIIPRALYYSTPKSFDKDISKLERIYPKSDILYFIQNTKEMIANDVCVWVAERYKAPVKLRWDIKNSKRGA